MPGIFLYGETAGRAPVLTAPAMTVGTACSESTIRLACRDLHRASARKRTASYELYGGRASDSETGRQRAKCADRAGGRARPVCVWALFRRIVGIVLFQHRQHAGVGLSCLGLGRRG